MRPLLTVFLLSLGLQAVANDSDAVNERIPVRASQIEDHWGIDCRSAWDALVASNCEENQALAETLLLCGAIYPAPGDSQATNCPDYNGAAAILAEKHCEDFESLLRNALDCKPTQFE